MPPLKCWSADLRGTARRSGRLCRSPSAFALWPDALCGEQSHKKSPFCNCLQKGRIANGNSRSFFHPDFDRRLWNFTRSAPFTGKSGRGLGPLGLTTGGDFHPALKQTINSIVRRSIFCNCRQSEKMPFSGALPARCPPRGRRRVFSRPRFLFGPFFPGPAPADQAGCAPPPGMVLF